MAEETSVTFSSIGKTRTITDISSVRDTALHAGQLAPFLGKQYSIFILDTQTKKVAAGIEFQNLNPAAANASPEYFFEVAPKVQDVGEPFATKITPTQGAGKFVESHGSLIKNIMIKGTTGIRPRKSRGPASGIPIIGEAINDLTNQFQLTDQRRNISKGEQTGFDDITFLRNIFRAYSDIKENNEFSNNILMVWRNNKDQDSWIVEPVDFKIARSSSSPLTYEYQITFQTLAPLEVALRQDVEDPLKAVLAVRKVFSRVQEFNQSLRRSFLIVSTQIRRLEGLGVYAQTQLLAPIINVTRGLGIVRYTGATFGVRLRNNAQVLSSELDQAIALLTGSPGVEPQDALVRSLRRARITCSRILVEPGVRESVGSESSGRQGRYSSAYISGGDTVARVLVSPDTGGSSTFIGNVSSSDNIAQGKVHLGEDIRTCAGRLLGDRSSWHILAAMNNLVSPYITSDGAGDTLSPGEAILYPSQQGVSSNSINPVHISDSEAELDDTPIQHAYGRDIRLKSVPVGLSDLADFYINQRGDISTIVGVPNVNQAIVLKFSTEKGELPVHSYYGASFPVGTKSSINSVNDFRTQTEATLYSDQRVQRINALDFEASGDVLLVAANLTLINSTDSLSLTIPLRRL